MQENQILPDEAVLWWLGQAGYLIRTGAVTIAIDPYLSDSAATGLPQFSRLYPPPFKADELKADIYIVTHTHADHLDPQTLQAYAHKDTTRFVAPRLACQQLAELGIPVRNISRVDVGESWADDTVRVSGVFALPTGVDVLDTTGYHLEFANGRTFYHTSDTQYHPLVVAAAPQQPEVMVVPINGKWNNTNAEQAADFAAQIRAVRVIPNHYDMMALNAENPEVFRWFCEQMGLKDACMVATVLQPIRWNGNREYTERQMIK